MIIPFSFMRGIDPQAQAHYDRVIADGGNVPAGLLGCNSFFVAVKAVYSTTDITTALSAGYDPHYLGNKLGAGSGTTLGQAAQKLYSCCGSSGDLEQTTAASQPLLLLHDGANNYWFGSGVTGNYCSTPNAAANQITGDIEIIAKINFNTVSKVQTIASKWGAIGNLSWVFYLTSSNKLEVAFSLNGTSILAATSTITTGFVINTDYWVKVNRISSSGEFKFYTSIDGITYTQLGTNVSSTSGSLYNSTQSLQIGFYTSGASDLMQGKIYRATISNSIGGSPVVDFNPNSYAASTSQTTWTSATGEVWTINTGTATTGYKGTLVDRTILQFDRTSANLLASNNSDLNTTLGANHSSGMVAKRYSTTNNEFVLEVGGSYTDNNSTQWWLPGASSVVTRSNKGTALANNNSTGTVTVAKLFSYVDSIVFGSTSVQVVNATSNSGSYWNNTTNKPVPNTGLLVGKSAGVGNFNGQLNTFIFCKTSSNYASLNSFLQTFNNNFAF